MRAAGSIFTLYSWCRGWRRATNIDRMKRFLGGEQLFLFSPLPPSPLEEEFLKKKKKGFGNYIPFFCYPLL